jgi:hypothetical protein
VESEPLCSRIIWTDIPAQTEPPADGGFVTKSCVILAAKSNNMANKTKSMLQVRRILQLLSDGHSKREVSHQIGASRNTIDSYETRFNLPGKSYDELRPLSYTDLAAVVYPLMCQ